MVSILLSITDVTDKSRDVGHLSIETFEFKLIGIDDGMGLAISDILADLTEVTFAAYSHPHPEIDEHFMRVSIHTNQDEGEEKDILSIWQKALQEISAFADDLRVHTQSEGGGIQNWQKKLTFKENTRPSMANMLRRILLSEIDTVAISKVTFIENTSVLCDELLVHRLSQLPIRISTAEGNKGNKGNTVTCTLSKKFKTLLQQADDPLNVELHSTVQIMHTDMKVVGGEIMCLSRNEMGDLCHNRELAFPIVHLNPGEQIVFKAETKKGNGSSNPRFSAVGPLAYSCEPGDPITIIIESNGQLTIEEIMMSAVDKIVRHVQSLTEVEM